MIRTYDRVLRRSIVRYGVHDTGRGAMSGSPGKKHVSAVRTTGVADKSLGCISSVGAPGRYVYYPVLGTEQRRGEDCP